MTAFFIDKAGATQHVEVDPSIYKQAVDENKTVAHLINTKYGQDCDTKIGTPFQQICASVGLAKMGANPFGLRSPTVADILDGKAGFLASTGGNTATKPQPWGNSSRTLFAAAVIEMIEDQVQPDTQSDEANFRSMVKMTTPIGGDVYTRPVISYANAGGANKGTNGAKAARVVQLGELPTMLKITTSDKHYTIPAYGIGIEMSEQAQRASTLDEFGLTIKRYIQIEKDARVYTYLSNLFLGDNDQNVGAISAVTTVSLDAACPAGTVTHKAWLKFLARNRRKRKITHAICDLDTYMKIEARSGRPGSNNYDPTLVRIDPQIKSMTQNLGFGNDVQWMIVDSAADGGPVPANTVWALDKEQAIKLVTNTSADYKATEQFLLRRSEMMVWTWSEEAMRLYGDIDTSAFDVLTIS